MYEKMEEIYVINKDRLKTEISYPCSSSKYQLHNVRSLQNFPNEDNGS